jgi:hypothetical protein
MTLTQKECDYLLSLPKMLVEDGEFLTTHTRHLQLPVARERFYMASQEDDDYTFILDVTQGAKNSLRLSLHFQEDDTSIGLLRIDYNAGHKNPETVTDAVPAALSPYAGQQLDGNHIHYFVEGYKPLAWAMPLSAAEFPIVDFADAAGIPAVIQAFGEKINLTTHLNLTLQTRLAL